MSDPIKHVVTLILENHSFDQMVGSLKEVFSDLDGIVAASPAVNAEPSGALIAQSEQRVTQMVNDPRHEHSDVLEQLADGNGGFIRNFRKHYPSASTRELQAIMGFYPLGFLPALHTLGRFFRVCDHWFASVPGPTWPNRMFALSGTSMGAVLMPQGFHDLAMVSNQTQDTIFDRLAEAGHSWKVYYYDFPCSLLLTHQRRPERAKHYERIDDFFRAARHDEAAFPDFCLIEPKYNGLDQNDDHPPHNVMKAQKLIADVYNAIRGNEQLWQNTLLVVFYDEHGGFYDHVPPPPAVPPDEHVQEYTFDRLGVRVPAILISPWLARGVDHTVYDHTSLLKYLIEKWKLAPLTKRVDAAHSILQDAFLTVPRVDTPTFIRVPYGTLLPEHPEWELSDVSVHHTAVEVLAASLVDKLERAFGERAMLLGLRLWGWVGARLVSWGRRMTTPAAKRRDRLLDAAHARIIETAKMPAPPA